MIWLAVFIFILSILSLGDVLEARSKKIALCVAGVLMSCTAGLRNVGGGEADYLIYKNHYYGIKSLNYVDYFEPGYTFSVWIARNIGLSYNIFILLLTSISIFFLLRLFYKYSKAPMLSILIYMSTYFLFYNMVLLRQMIAVVAFLYCVVYIVQNKKISFLVSFFLGFLFHHSIIILIPIYLILKVIRPNLLSFIIIVCCATLFHVIGLPVLIGAFSLFVGEGLAGRLLAYSLDQNEFRLNILEYLKMIVVLAMILLFYKQWKDDEEAQIYVKLYYIFCGFIIAFGNIEILFRIAMYFDLVILLLIPLIIFNIRPLIRTRLLIYSVVACFTIFAFLYRARNFNDGEFFQYKFYFLDETIVMSARE